MEALNDFQAFLKLYLGVNTTSVVVLVLVAMLSLFLYNAFGGHHDLPGPSFLEMLPNGEIYPLLHDSRATLRTLLKLSEKYGEVFQTWMGPRRMVVSANPGDIAQVLSATDEFVRPEGMVAMFDAIVPGGLLSMPKEIHIASRKKLKNNFNFSMLQNCHKYLTDAVAELCEDLDSLVNHAEAGHWSKTVDISESLATTTFRIIISLAFGCDMRREKRTEFATRMNQLIDEMLKELIGYPVRQAMTVFGVRKGFFNARAHIYLVCDAFIRRRLEESPEEKGSRPSDALDAILSLDHNDQRAIASQTVEFSVAGSHTTSQVLAWCIYEICRNPRVEAELQREIDMLLSSKPLSEPLEPDDVQGMTYLSKVWKEAIRLHPPGGFIMRTTSGDITLRGSQVKLRKGTHVVALLHRAQNNPKTWRDPDTFLPERWGSGTERGEGDKVPKGSYVPFSIGQKNCLGRFLANHEGVLILAELYRRFRFALGCDPNEVVTCTGWVESARYASVKGGDFDMGVPVQVQARA